MLFRSRGRVLPSYPAMLYLGIVLGVVVGNVAGNATGMPTGRVYIATLILLVPALAGARLASVLGSWRLYRGRQHWIWRRADGGQAMYGGLVAVPASVPLLASLGIPFWAFWDVATFTMLTGMIFTRMGCLLTGCCAGRPTQSRFGLVLPGHRGVRTRRIPTQLLEAALAAVLLAGAALVVASEPPPGTVFTGSLALYAAGRLFLQPLRERQTRIAGVPALSAASGTLVAVAASSILMRVL